MALDWFWFTKGPNVIQRALRRRCLCAVHSFPTRGSAGEEEPRKTSVPLRAPLCLRGKKKLLCTNRKKNSQSAKRKKVPGFALFENFLWGSAKGRGVQWDFKNSFLRGERKTSNKKGQRRGEENLHVTPNPLCLHGEIN